MFARTFMRRGLKFPVPHLHKLPEHAGHLTIRLQMVTVMIHAAASGNPKTKAINAHEFC